MTPIDSLINNLWIVESVDEGVGELDILQNWFCECSFFQYKFTLFSHAAFWFT